METKLYFYNTLTRKKEVFTPLKTDFVRMYDCGPTVYMYAHIGNMWRYLMSDLIRRALEYNGYRVKQVMNITDVGHLTAEELAADAGEDKVEVTAKKEKKTPQEVAAFYTRAFLKDLDRLNIQHPHVMPKATEHIGDMISLIRRLEKKGYTYRAGMYLCFDISKFRNYGKLSGKSLQDLRAGARLEPVPGKRNPFDFALWIADSSHLQRWDSPWGVGYPGWHIECSAMSMKHLGEQLDIHTGGEDNIFPHHENEIAQSEAVTGKKFVQYWIHARFLQVDGEKMSKSKGNLYTLDDLIEKGYDPLAFRYLCLTAHYRHPLNFTWQGLSSAANALRSLRREIASWGILPEEVSSSSTVREEEFLAAVNDDLDMPRAIALIWDLVKSRASPAVKYATLLSWDKVLGLRLDELLESNERECSLSEVPAEVARWVRERENLRKVGNFAAADELRRKIWEAGYRVEDTPEGPRLLGVRPAETES